MKLFVGFEVGGWNLAYSYFLNAKFEVEYFVKGPSLVQASQIKDVRILSEFNELDLTKYDEVILSPPDRGYSAGAEFLDSVLYPLISILGKYDRRCTVILDNWVNFEIRLQNLDPEKTIVFDTYAYEYASGLVGKTSELILEENWYLENMRIQLRKKMNSDLNILAIHARKNSYTTYSRPISDSYCICAKLSRVLLNLRDSSICFRIHPSESDNSCADHFGEKYPHLSHRFRKSFCADLVADLKEASLVIGMPSYALYLSHKLGFSTYFVDEPNELWNGPRFPNLAKLTVS